MTPPRAVLRNVERALVAVCALFASWTVLTQLALLAGLSLRALFAAYLGLLGLGGVAAGVWARRHRPSFGAPDPVAAALLAGASLAGGLLSLAAIRPAPDDVNYAARAVYFLAHPSQPLDLAFHDHAFLAGPLTYPLLLNYAGELFWAFVATCLRIEFIDAYQLVAPFVGGALVPLAWALVLARFVPDARAAALGAVAIAAYLCCDGASHQGFGNYAFARIWQGKVLLLAVGVPIFTAFALDWLEEPRGAAWLRLFLAAVAASGLTGTALFLLPLLALALGAGHLAAHGLGRRALLAVVGLGASLGYGVVLGLGLRATTNPADYHYLGFEVGFAETFVGQLAMVFPLGVPIALVAFAVSALACMALLAPPRRRFLLAWIAALGVLALNPLVMPLIVELLSTYNAYWRVFYALPFPLTLGLAAALLAQRARLPAAGYAGVAGALVAGALVFQAAAPALSTFGNVRFALGSYKMDAGLIEELREIAAYAVPGSMLAPYEVSVALPLLSAAFPQVSVDGFFLEHFARLEGRREVALSRRRAVRYAAGHNPAGAPDVVALVEAGLRNLVIGRSQSTDRHLLDALQPAGEWSARPVGRFVVFRRHTEPAAR